MANDVAALKLVLSYPAPGGGTVTPPAMAVNAPFLASAVGFVDVPAAMPGGTSLDVPFGSISDGATLLMVVNKTGQDLEVFLNSNDTGSALPDGGIAMFGAASVSGAPLTAASVTLSGDQGDTPGQVACFVFGDPA